MTLLSKKLIHVSYLNDEIEASAIYHILLPCANLCPSYASIARPINLEIKLIVVFNTLLILENISDIRIQVQTLGTKHIEALSNHKVFQVHLDLFFPNIQQLDKQAQRRTKIQLHKMTQHLCLYPTNLKDPEFIKGFLCIQFTSNDIKK